MKCRVAVLLSWAILFLAPWSAKLLAQAPSPTYQLLPGDALFVSVWREPTLQRETRVLPDGSITFPLAGRVDVGGVSAQEAATRIAAKLKEYLPDPVVTVVITATEGNRVFVLGKVQRPGPQVLVGPTTVLQALAMAGGLDRFADEKEIKVIRDEGDGRRRVLRVDYRRLASGEDLASNHALRPGDTLLVP